MTFPTILSTACGLTLFIGGVSLLGRMFKLAQRDRRCVCCGLTWCATCYADLCDDCLKCQICCRCGNGEN